jgi:hypothetical protein
VLAPADAAAELMELGQTESLRVFDQHHGCIWNIDTDLDHSRADQNFGFAAAESFHDFLFFRSGNSSVQQLARVRMQTFPPALVLRCRRFCLEFFALFDQRINNIKLAAGLQLRAQESEDLAEF